jgi:uncharacterized sulfatase
MLRLFFLFSAFLLTCSTGWSAPPNVLFILSDDQAWNDYGFVGHEHIETPRIDRLAAESLTFTRGYVPDSLCRPSLATIISGLYPHEHGIVGNDPPPPPAVQGSRQGDLRRAPRYLEVLKQYNQTLVDDPRLPAILGEKLGYLSFQTGKWWEGNFSNGGFTHGMTHGDPTRGGRHGDIGLKIGREGIKPIADFVAMAREQDKPFFLWYAPIMPHTPHTPPERLLEKYRSKTPHLPIAKYWAMCEWFDETVGEVLDVLEENKVADNTIVVYVCDNGWINMTDSSRYAPRSKRSQYDGGVRTPIMIRWPGHIAPKMDREHAVSSIDLAPTVLKAIGLKPDPRMTGVDLTDAEAVASRDAIYGEILEHDVRHMTDPVQSLMHRWIIHDGWKLIVPDAKNMPDDRLELFRIVEDPFEKQNVAQQNPEVVEKLTTKLNAWWNPRGEQ